MYYYSVSARNIAGEGNLSVLVMATPGTVPSAPQGLNASAGNGIVALTWLAPADNGGFPVTNYTIYRGTAPGNLTLLAWLRYALNFTDIDLANGRTYYYRVSASNARGEGILSPEINATPLKPNTAPGKPMNIKARPADHMVNLSWSAPDDNGGLPVTGYRVYRSNTSSNFQFLRSLTINSTTDDGLMNQMSYFYRVAAVNDLGEGTLSDIVSAVPWSVPSAPQNLTLARKGGGVLLKWDAPADDGGAGISFSRVYRGDGPQNLVALANVVKSSLTFTDTNLVPGKRYFYSVVAVILDFEGAPTAVKDISVPKEKPADGGSMMPVALVAIVAVAGAVGAVLFLRSRKKSPPV
jgi:hypothetical protein